MSARKDIFELYFRECMDDANAAFEARKSAARGQCERTLAIAESERGQTLDKAEADYQCSMTEAASANQAGAENCRNYSDTHQASACLEDVRAVYDAALASARSARDAEQIKAERNYVRAYAAAQERLSSEIAEAERELAFARAHCGLYLSDNPPRSAP